MAISRFSHPIRSRPPGKATSLLYIIPVLSKALGILEFLQVENQPRSVEEIVQCTKIPRTTVYRILKTFTHRRHLARCENGLYRFVSRARKVRFGFGAQYSDAPFFDAVRQGLLASGSAASVDLLLLDNKSDAATALRNADEFISQRADVVIEFQMDPEIAPIVADKLHSAGIPLIAVDSPHSHATFLGIDDYRAGYEAGAFLAQHAKRHWGGEVNWAVGLDIQEAGALIHSRINGALAGIRSKLPGLRDEKYILLNSQNLPGASHRLMLGFLRRHPRQRGILVAAATDVSALGALRAIHEASRVRDVAIVGQGCIPESLDEMRIPGSPLIGSISHEAGRYGSQLIQLGLAMLNGQTVPPYNYVKHKLVAATSLAKRTRIGRARVRGIGCSANESI